MKTLLAIFIAIASVGISEGLAPIQFSLGKILGGLFGGGLTKHESSEIVGSTFRRDQKSAEEPNCHRAPVKQCKDVFETVYERVEENICEERPVEECHEETVTEYEEVARQQCDDVTEEQCEDVEDRTCNTVKKPVQVVNFFIVSRENRRIPLCYRRPSTSRSVGPNTQRGAAQCTKRGKSAAHSTMRSATRSLRLIAMMSRNQFRFVRFEHY